MTMWQYGLFAYTGNYISSRDKRAHMQKMSITLEDGQVAWLKEHDEINLSGLVRKWLATYMNTQKEHICSSEA